MDFYTGDEALHIYSIMLAVPIAISAVIYFVMKVVRYEGDERELANDS